MGTALSFAIFYSFRERDRVELRSEFQAASANYASALTQEMDRNLTALGAASAFAEVEGSLRRDNFEPFARKQIDADPNILCLEWLPRVFTGERANFEKEISASESRPVHITYGTSLNPVPAGEAPVYFPIALMYPRTAAANVIGFDGYTRKDLRATLDRARDNGRPAAAFKFRVVEPTVDGFAVPVYIPVYRGPADHSTVEGRREDLAGYVLEIFELGSAVERAISRVSSSGSVQIQLYDLSAEEGRRILHSHRSGDAPDPLLALADGGGALRAEQAAERGALTPAPLKSITPIDFASRRWVLVCTPTDGAFQNTSWGHTWGVLIAGLFCTLCIAAYVSVSASHRSRAEGFVAEFYRINSRLTNEITDRKKAEEEITRLNLNLEARVLERTEELRESDERYALAAQGSKDGLWDWNFATGEIYFSTRWKNMLGYGEDEIADDPQEWFRLMHPDELARVRAEMAAHCAGETPQFQSEHRMRHKDGAYLWMLSRGVAVLDERGAPVRMAGSQTDINEGKIADALTGLPNRVFLADKLQNAVERARMSGGGQFALLFLDLDQFKVVKDSLGHQASEQLLRAMSQRLLGVAAAFSLPRHLITVAGLGGDEFAVLLGAIARSSDATAFAEAIQSAMKPAFDVDGKPVFASCSMGVAFGGPDSHPDELVRDADTAMNFAKSNGKHRYEIYDAAMRERSIARLQLEADLRGAISRNELEVYYQPKVSLATGQVVELEALVRWRHPVRGMVQPQDFIPLADETGLICAIGEWVLEASCRQVVEWRRKFGSKAGVSVNVSTRQFESFDLVAKIRGVLAATSLPPSFLSLEVTESLLLENPESAIQQLGQLRDLGVDLKIDDFGTGFSSLSYLHRLPFNELKIDRSFVTGMSKTRESEHIIRTIVLLARNLRMRVVAEGVETEEQLAQLAALSCDFVQGNYFSKPVPAEIAERFLGPSCPSLLPSSFVFPNKPDGLEDRVRIQ